MYGFVDMKKHLIRLITKFSVGSWNLMAFCIGNWPRLDPIYQIEYCGANGVDSQIENIDIGVPQGSCFGPILFLVYINDLLRAVKNSVTSMYADDTSLCFKSKDLSQLNETLNDDLPHLDTWLISNKLSLNLAKTQSMLVSAKAKRNALDKSNQNLQVKLMERSLRFSALTSLYSSIVEPHFQYCCSVQLRLIVCKIAKQGC